MNLAASGNAEISSEEYLTHQVFPDLKYYIEFYDMLSFSIPDTPTDGVHFITNMDVYVYSSMCGTLESIQHVLKSGRLGDAYALLRKFYDSAIINIYTNLYAEDHRSLENLLDQKIKNWLHGQDTLPDYREMSQYVRKSSKLCPINELLYANDLYKDIRGRCNDSLHYNFFKNVLINDNQIHSLDRLNWLHQLSQDIKMLFILHLSYIFFLNCHYMMSSDYIDALEVGMTPEKDSQYWVAPFIQKAFDDYITKERPDIAVLIKNHTCMLLD